jgi:hypothetical protein
MHKKFGKLQTVYFVPVHNLVELVQVSPGKLELLKYLHERVHRSDFENLRHFLASAKCFAPMQDPVSGLLELLKQCGPLLLNSRRSDTIF